MYQALVSKYNGLFPGFSDDIPKTVKFSTDGAVNYRPELNAIREKLELALVVEQNKDPLYKFKEIIKNCCIIKMIMIQFYYHFDNKDFGRNYE